MRPVLVAEQRKKLMALFAQTFSRYEDKNSEPAAAPNGGQSKLDSAGSGDGRPR